MTFRERIVCTLETIDKEHIFMEMLMSSMFDASYTIETYGVILSNGNIEYTYQKTKHGFEMFVKLLSLSKPNPKFSIRFSAKPFEITRFFIEKHWIDFIDFSKLQPFKKLTEEI